MSEKMWRWADVKMSRCERRYDEESEQMREDVREDMKMSRCEDEQMWEKMWRWADVKMSRCEDEKVWRWEGEIQTPTIGRTLRSDALGKNFFFWRHESKFALPKILWSLDSCHTACFNYAGLHIAYQAKEHGQVETIVSRTTNCSKSTPLQARQFFFRPTPSWLPPGRSTRSIACCKIGLID